MTGEERDITGVKDVRELKTLRDGVADATTAINELTGVVREHIRAEDERHKRIEEWMFDEPDRIHKGIEQHGALANPDVKDALEWVDSQRGLSLDRRAVVRARDRDFRRAIIVLVVLVIGAAAVLEFVDKEKVAGAAFAVIAVATPFTLWYLNRPQK